MKKKIIALMLSVAAVLSCSSALAAGYSDVSNTAWYYDYVNRISELKAFSGYEDGTFRPENEITQEEFLKTVVCLVGGELTDDNMAATKNPWGDTWDAWAVPYLDKACELGLVTAEDTMFRYVAIPCSRAEMAKLITRAVDYMGEDAVKDTSTYVSKMKDYDRIKEDYRPYVLQAYAKGIISGYEDGSFKPDGYLTRAEASSVLVRLVDKDARVTETTSGSSSGGHSSTGEKTYDFYGRQVTWTEPLRTDVPEQYQVSLADLMLPQSSIDENITLGVGLDKQALSYSKALMFEDLVLQSITYDGDTVKLTIPDYLPQNQAWSVSVSYWNISEGYDFMNITGKTFTEPGEYTVSGVKVLEDIAIYVDPINDDDAITANIHIRNGKSLSLERLPYPEVHFNTLEGIFKWEQGKGYKDYLDGYTGKVYNEIDW